MTSERGKEGGRETEIDKDREREKDGAKMTWIHSTSIDY